MKLDRAQTLITRCPNDIVCLRADGQAFRSVQIQDIQCSDQSAYCARFKEGTYEYHVKNFNVAPDLSAYMLGYSKMLMRISPTIRCVLERCGPAWFLRHHLGA